jgi:hypothetical protein
VDERELKGKEAELLKELEEFNREKSRVRNVIGSIGGKSYNRIDTIINIVFLCIIAVLFGLEMTTKLMPVFISIEIGILLVSIKIVWMIHSHNKFYHFQFWVLNSIEFRINDLVKRVRNIEDAVSGRD